MRTNISHLAERFGVSRRTATTWKKKGAPVHDDRLLKSWLATRQRVSPGARRAVSSAKPTAPTSTSKPARKPKPAPDGIAGAAQALKRLESAELAAFDRLEEATSEGADAVTLAELRKSWLAISESLRKFDLLVEQNRREAGDLVPREVLENALDNFAHGAWMTLRLYQSSVVNRLLGAKEPWQIGQILDELLKATWLFSAIGMMPQEKGIGETLKKRIQQKFVLSDERFEERKRNVDLVLKTYRATVPE